MFNWIILTWCWLFLCSDEPSRELNLPASATKTSITNLTPDVDYAVTISSYYGSDESLPLSGQITSESHTLWVDKMEEWLRNTVNGSLHRGNPRHPSPSRNGVCCNLMWTAWWEGFFGSPTQGWLEKPKQLFKVFRDYRGQRGGTDWHFTVQSESFV